MKLAVKKEQGAVPGGGFHYMLHPMKMEPEGQAEIYKLMGYIIIEVSEDEGERLLKEAVAALRHQYGVAVLAEQALKTE